MKKKNLGLTFSITDTQGNEILPQRTVYFDERYSRQTSEYEKEVQEMRVIIKTADNVVISDSSRQKNKNRKRNEFNNIKFGNKNQKQYQKDQQKQEVKPKEVQKPIQQQEEKHEEVQQVEESKNKYYKPDLTNRIMMVPNEQPEEKVEVKQEEPIEENNEEETYPVVKKSINITEPKLEDFNKLPDSLKSLVVRSQKNKQQEQKQEKHEEVQQEEQEVPNGVVINKNDNYYERMAQEMGYDTDGDLYPRNEKIRKNNKGGEF